MEDRERVTWVGPFRIDVEPITKGEFLRYLLATGQKPPYEIFRLQRKEWIPVKGSLSDPMKDVSWFEARQYAKWVGKRLPTWIEMFRAARGFDERGWIAGSPSDIAPLNNDLELYYSRKVLPKDLPERQPNWEMIQEKKRAFIHKCILSNSAKCQIRLTPDAEWVERSLEETMDDLECRLLVPQARRYSSYYYSFFNYPAGSEDCRRQDFIMGNLIPNFNLSEVKRALRENSSANSKSFGEIEDKEKPLFMPGAFFGDDPLDRRNTRSMDSTLNGEYQAGRVGFRCATDVSLALAPGHSWDTIGVDSNG